MNLNLPNALTISRVLLTPLLVGTFFLEGETGNWAGLAVFTVAGLTDFLDGYVARATHQQSDVGRFLDPVADKLLVASAILMLAAFDRIGGLLVLPAVLILCREIVVSGLREFLAELKVGVPVSRLAKWKTFIQMVAIGFLLVSDAAPAAIPAAAIGAVALWLAAGLTLVTGYDYLRVGIRHIIGAEAEDEAEEPPAGERPRPAG